MVVTSVNVPSNVSPGSTVTVKDTVSNTGTETANGLHVDYYIQNEYAVVKKPATQHNASIYGDKVVWADCRYDRDDADIYWKNITGTEDGYISTFSGGQANPAIYGDVIVWQYNYNGIWTILGYKVPGRDDPIDPNVPDIYRLYASNSNQINPQIYNDKIVWQQFNSTTQNWDIYLYDFTITGDIAMPKGKETVQITKDGADHENPYVDGNYIVWQQKNGNGDWHIYTYDLSTGKIIQVSTAPGNQTNPMIYGGNIVWEQGNADGTHDIYMYDLSKYPSNPIPISTNAADQINPAIYGDKIVWQDNRNGNWDIYMYDLTQRIERQLTVNTGNQVDPAIYDNKVVWTDDRNGTEDIYITDNIISAPEYNRYISSLAPNTSNSVPTNIKLPSDLKANVNYYIISMVEDESGNIISTKMGSTPMIVPDVDLTIPSISGPAAAQPGKTVTIATKLKNTGSQNSNTFWVYFYLSKDSTITTSDIYLGKYQFSVTTNGTNDPIQKAFTIPSSLSGSYYIGAIIDPGNEQCETNKLNNIAISSNTIDIGAPDLVITSISTGSTSYKKGSTITIQNTVKNQGSAGANGFYVNFYLSKDSTITTSDIYLGNRYISSLPAGTSTSPISDSFTLPSNISGNYYVGAIVDPTNSVAETNELNNIGVSSNIISINTPDIAATAISTGSISYKKGSKITIKSTVKNQGSATSGKFYVKFYLSKNSGYTTSSDIYLGYRSVSSLGVGSSNKATKYLKIPSNIKKGHYCCKMVIYPVNRTADSKTSDKVICSRIWLDIH